MGMLERSTAAKSLFSTPARATMLPIIRLLLFPFSFFFSSSSPASSFGSDSMRLRLEPLHT